MTINQKIVDYIKTRRQKGSTDEEIKESLTSVGWSKEDVDRHFNLHLQKDDKEKIEAKGPVNFAYKQIINNPLASLKISIVLLVVNTVAGALYYFCIVTLFLAIAFFDLHFIVYFMGMILLSLLPALVIFFLNMGLVNISLKAVRGDREMKLGGFLEKKGMIWRFLGGNAVFILRPFIFAVIPAILIYGIFFLLYDSLVLYILGMTIPLLVYLMMVLKLFFFDFFMIDENLRPLESIRKSYQKTKNVPVLFFITKVSLGSVLIIAASMISAVISYIILSINSSAGFILSIPLGLFSYLIIYLVGLYLYLAKAYFYEERVKNN